MNTKICPHCHKQIDNDAVYCENCGAKVLTDFETTDNHQVKKKTSPKKLFKHLGISMGILLVTIIGTWMIISFSYQWRWERAYGPYNKFGIGGYADNYETGFGLYRFHNWYGYEDLTGGYTLMGIQVTNDYIAILEFNTELNDKKWSLWSPDFRYGYSFDGITSLYDDILPLSISSKLSMRTGLLWLKKGKYWGVVNLRTKTYQTSFEYEDIEPMFQVNNLGKMSIICKKNGLWGKIQISNSGYIEIEKPFVYNNPKILKREFVN